MKRVLAMVLQLCLFAFCITACGRSEVPQSAVPVQSAEQDLETTAGMGEQKTAEPEERNTEPMAEQGQTEQSEAAESTEPTSQEQTEYLDAIPAAYFENSDRPGQVIQVAYESRDYTGDDTAITKPAFVYLPYGYDESDTDTRYDILYLMHGWTMTANDFLGEGQGNLVNILDNMIASGDIPPVIVVSATFDAENQSQSFSRSVEELSVFHNDLRENLMPYIEDRFHTYAEDVTEEGFENSREHRAFGGFSLGAVTTWYQFIYNLDYIKNFVPMSGDCWIMGTYGGRYYPVETVDYLYDEMEQTGKAEVRMEADEPDEPEFTVRVTPFEREGSNMVGLVNIVLNDSFAVGNVSVVQGRNGMFVAMPSYKAGNKYRDVCFPITKEFREKVNNAVLETYQQAKEQAMQEGQERASQQMQNDDRGFMKVSGEPLPFR